MTPATARLSLLLAALLLGGLAIGLAEVHVATEGTLEGRR